MKLAGDPASPRLVATSGNADHTARMKAFIRRKLDELAGAAPCGYVCKKGSPSCAMGGAAGAGLFTAAFMARFPLVPVEDEGRLKDPPIRDRFVERVLGTRA